MENKLYYYHVNRIVGALQRKQMGIDNQKEYLTHLKELINQEKNPYLLEDKLQRYAAEKETLKAWEENLKEFINIKIPEYCNKRNLII